MKNFLLDVNLSPKTGIFLKETFDFDVVYAGDILPPGATDEEVVALAIKEKRIIITLDLDFGEIYHFRQHRRLGVIVLRLRDQTRPCVNQVLQRFFTTDAKTINLTKSLVILKESDTRIVS